MWATGRVAGENLNRATRRLAPTVANVKNLHRIAFDGKHYPIHVGLTAVEELAYFKGKASGFGSKGTPLRECSQRRNGLFQGKKLSKAGLSGMLR